MSRHPGVKWAQRSDKLFITIDLPDAKDVKLKLEPEGKFFFSATAGSDNIPYEVDMDLFDKVDVNESGASIGLRNIVYVVQKAESKWWSRLLKNEGKPPIFLKVDWNKWVDEDEQDETPEPDMDIGDVDFSKLNMGGGGADFDADADDLDEEEYGSETEEAVEEEENEEEAAPDSRSEPATEAKA